MWVTNRLPLRRHAEARPIVQARREIAALTDLRGICASLIIIFHMNGSYFAGHWHPDALLSTIFTRAYLVVDVFFILSGFLIMRSSLLSNFNNSPRAITEFWLRRIARVWPLHALVLLLFIGSPYCTTSGDLIFTLTMTHAWGFLPYTTCNVPSWAVSCEWLIYLLFPMIFWLLLKAQREDFLRVVPGLATGGLAILACLTPDHNLDLTSNLGVLRSGFDFLIGASLSLISNNWKTSTMFDFAVVMFAGNVILLALTRAQDIWIVSLLGPLVICIALSNSWIERLFSCAPLVWLGKISYSSYMVHKFVLDHSMKAVTSYGRLVAGFALVTCIAAISYTFIEQPTRAALDWLAKRLIAGRWDIGTAANVQLRGSQILPPGVPN